MMAVWTGNSQERITVPTIMMVMIMVGILKMPFNSKAHQQLCGSLLHVLVCTVEGCRRVLKSGWVRTSSNVVGIICPPG